MVEESEEVVEEVVEEKKTDTTPLIDVANSVAERIEKANQTTAELLDRQEQADARRALGGQSEAGQAPVKPTAPTDEEIAEKFDKGEVDILK